MEPGEYGLSFVDLNNHSIRMIFIDTYRIIQTGIKKNKVPEEEKLLYHNLDSIIGEAYLADSIHDIIGGAGSKTNKLSEKEIALYNPASPKDYLLWNSVGFFELKFENQSDKLFLYDHSGQVKCEITQ